MGKEELVQVEFVGDKKKPPGVRTNPIQVLDKLIEFFDRDIDDVIDYIDENQVPVHWVTLNRRIDLHPTRDYLIRIPRVIGDIIRVKKVLEDEGDELDGFWVGQI